MIKIATWNVNSIKVRLPYVLQWLESYAPDILALQETKTLDEHFPCEAISQLGYHIICSGQKTYNGVALLSKSAASSVITSIVQLNDPQKRILAATIDGVRILNLYVPNGQAVGSEKYAYKLDWLAKMHDYIQQQLLEFDKLVVLGDFNIAPEDCDVHDPQIWQDGVLVSSAEREAFQGLLDLGLQDGFRLHEQAGGYYTWWDYRRGAFRRDMGLRIDHILLSAPLAEQCKACDIDKEPRGWERPSDHAVVWVELG
ncbi:MAG: exodeoxyribonuclease III [Gammaproteobacteria bacterium]